MDIFHKIRLLKGRSNTFRYGVGKLLPIHSFSVPVSHHTHSKECLPHTQSNQASFHSKALLLVLLLQALVKSLSPTFFQPPLFIDLVLESFPFLPVTEPSSPIFLLAVAKCVKKEES